MVAYSAFGSSLGASAGAASAGAASAGAASAGAASAGAASAGAASAGAAASFFFYHQFANTIVQSLNNITFLDEKTCTWRNINGTIGSNWRMFATSTTNR